MAHKCDSYQILVWWLWKSWSMSPLPSHAHYHAADADVDSSFKLKDKLYIINSVILALHRIDMVRCIGMVILNLLGVGARHFCKYWLSTYEPVGFFYHFETNTFTKYGEIRVYQHHQPTWILNGSSTWWSEDNLLATVIKRKDFKWHKRALLESESQLHASGYESGFSTFVRGFW